MRNTIITIYKKETSVNSKETIVINFTISLLKLY